MDWSPDEIRALMDGLRLGVGELADHLGVAQKSVRNWLGQRHAIRPSSQRLLDAAHERLTPQQEQRFELALERLSTPRPSESERIGVLPGASTHDPDLRDRAERAIADPTRVDRAVVDSFAGMLEAQRHLEDRVGSGPLVGLVTAQLDLLHGLAAGTSGALHERLVLLASEHAQFIAWMHHDQRRADDALVWYDRAADWAHEAGDATMAATVLSMKAHVAWSRGDPVRSVRLAQAAQWHTPRLTPGARGMAAQMEARGHAVLGDAASTDRKLEEAEVLLGRAAEHVEDEPPWLYFYSPVWLSLQRGMADLALGRNAAAIRRLETGLAALPESYRRDRAWYQACLARAHAGAGNVEQALDVARVVLPEVSAIKQRHAADELLAALQSIRQLGADEGRMRELEEELRLLT